MALHLTSALLTFSTQFDFDRDLKNKNKKLKHTKGFKCQTRQESQESEHLKEMYHTGMGDWF